MLFSWWRGGAVGAGGGLVFVVLELGMFVVVESFSSSTQSTCTNLPKKKEGKKDLP